MQIKPDIDQMKSRLGIIRDEIMQAAIDCNRNPAEITLIGVSKFFPPEYAQAAVSLGLKDLGENRVQEMIEKIDVLEQMGMKPNWHLIGTLQKNKVKYVIGKAHLIHSVDKISLLEEINKCSEKKNIVTDVLLQVNISGEQTKHGFIASELCENIENFSKLAFVRIRGLMTMAPIMSDPELTRPIFTDTKELFDELRLKYNNRNFSHLSMGMSQDYRQAIACGATHVRIGTAIFGSRI